MGAARRTMGKTGHQPPHETDGFQQLRARWGVLKNSGQLFLWLKTHRGVGYDCGNARRGRGLSKRDGDRQPRYEDGRDLRPAPWPTTVLDDPPCRPIAVQDEDKLQHSFDRDSSPS